MRICNQQSGRTHTHAHMKKTMVVVAITLLTMVAEIIYGIITGSMALLADGIHMGTHTFALMITLITYFIAEKHAENPDFAFSSGKVGVLGGYTNAIILGITAIFMIYEAIQRLIEPEPIQFTQALIVAFVGLAVNLTSAAILSSGEDEHHDHDHHHHDHNLRAAYIHVITDALTSVLAIVALLSGKFFSQTWPDAAVAILGALVILKWAYGLLNDTGKILVDYHNSGEERERVARIAGESGSHVLDIHIWHTSGNHKAMIIHLEAGKEFEKEPFISKIRSECHCHHITVELE